MKYIKCVLLFAVLLTFGLSPSTSAETVTEIEARQIANNWITQIIYYTGEWNKQASAEVTTIEPFRTDYRLLGYYCTIEPSGFIIVSAVKGLAPVKIYSPTSALDVDATEGPTALFKFQMERLIREVELQVGPVDKITLEEVEPILVNKQTERFNMLTKSSEEFRREISKDVDKRDYIEEEILLSSHWRQGSPYNLQVPAGSGDCAKDNCAVGCTATASAQIMRYWSWPPGRDWTLMLDFIDTLSATEHIDAIAELCSAIGVACGMNYCVKRCLSSAPMIDMEAAFEEWHYGDCSIADRDDHTQEEWWQMAKAYVSANQPIEYEILKHMIVLDGWREWYNGTYTPEYHMNYGWGGGADAWYEIDKLHQVDDEGSWEHEKMLKSIHPGVSLHSSVAGIQYKMPFNYRYVNKDCTGHAVDFYPGQFIQFLPGVTLVCTELMMRISGLPDDNSYLYTPVPDRGIRINNGAMKFYPGCGIRFQQSRPGP